MRWCSSEDDLVSGRVVGFKLRWVRWDCNGMDVFMEL